LPDSGKKAKGEKRSASDQGPVNLHRAGESPPSRTEMVRLLGRERKFAGPMSKKSVATPPRAGKGSRLVRAVQKRETGKRGGGRFYQPVQKKRSCPTYVAKADHFGARILAHFQERRNASTVKEKAINSATNNFVEERKKGAVESGGAGEKVSLQLYGEKTSTVGGRCGRKRAETRKEKKDRRLSRRWILGDGYLLETQTLLQGRGKTSETCCEPEKTPTTSPA